jgi:hypothetical protein
MKSGWYYVVIVDVINEPGNESPPPKYLATTEYCASGIAHSYRLGSLGRLELSMPAWGSEAQYSPSLSTSPHAR